MSIGIFMIEKISNVTAEWNQQSSRLCRSIKLCSLYYVSPSAYKDHILITYTISLIGTLDFFYKNWKNIPRWWDTIVNNTYSYIHTCRNKVKDAWLQLCSQLVFGPTKYCTIIATRVEAINKLEQKWDR